MDESSGLGAKPVGRFTKVPKSERPEVYEEGRVCPVCGFTLARMNKGPNCYLHTPKKKPRHYGRTRR
jgi:hypothetical protein